LIPDLAAKQLELISEFVPRLARIGVLRGRREGAQAMETIRTAAIALGIESHFEDLESHTEIASAFDRLADAQCEAIILVDGPTLNPQRELIARLALSHRLPTISTLRLFVEAGSLVAYGPSLGTMWRRAAYYVDRILKGAQPSELPIEQPSSFELVINQRTANLLGLVIAKSLLARADEVIE
jgi:putative ABC transport system substrate-binding protein